MFSIVSFSLQFCIYFSVQPGVYAQPEPIQQQTGVLLVGAFVFPHGGLTLNPETRDFSKVPIASPTAKEESLKLREGMKLAAQNLIQSKPDIILLSTPHGLGLEEEYLFYGNNRAQGSANAGELKDYQASINIDAELTQKLVKNLAGKGHLVELLRYGTENDPLNLRWGEVVPWWFIAEAAANAQVPAPKAIILGQPRRIKSKISDSLNVGGNMSYFLRKENLYPKSRARLRVAVVISADLSHYHSKELTSPYPYSVNATVFDKFIVNWAKMDYEPGIFYDMEQNLLKSGGELVESVGSCGYTGLVVLHGFMRDYLSAEENANLNFRAHVYHYAVPTYFGMMSAAWFI